jgi:hypothetical protein
VSLISIELNAAQELHGIGCEYGPEVYKYICIPSSVAGTSNKLFKPYEV